MKLQIDTKAKTIKVEEAVTIAELVFELELLIPKEDWPSYTIEMNTVVVHESPLTTPQSPYVWPSSPTTVPPWWPPYITCNT